MWPYALCALCKYVNTVMSPMGNSGQGSIKQIIIIIYYLERPSNARQSDTCRGQRQTMSQKKSSSPNPMTLNHRKMKRFNGCSQGPRQKLFVKELGSQPPGEEMEHVSQSELANFAKLTTPKFQNICSLMLLQAQGHHHQETNVRLSKYYFDNEHIGYHDNVEMQVTRLCFE